MICCATREMTGRILMVSGKSEAAKGVARRVAKTVAWSIEAIPVVRRVGLVTPNSPRDRLDFKIPSRLSSSLSPARGGRSAIFPEKLGAGAIAPPPDRARPAAHPLRRGHVAA